MNCRKTTDHVAATFLLCRIDYISIIIHQHIGRTCIYEKNTSRKQTQTKKTYNNAISAQCVYKWLPSPSCRDRVVIVEEV